MKRLIAVLALAVLASSAQAQTFVVCKTLSGGNEFLHQGSSCPSGSYFVRYG